MLTYWETLIATRSSIAVTDSYAELWGRKLSNAFTVATYTGTLPATLQTVDGYLESYKIYGNTEQAGTPTPENPIVPSGCGVRTGNLFDKSTISLNAYPGTNNTLVASPNTRVAYIPCMPSTTYTISKIKSNRFIVAYTKTIPAIGETAYGVIIDNNATKIAITTGNDASYIIIFYYHANYDTLTETEIKSSIMLNLGSTALPYEPYGYKLPILSNSTATNIYLGEAETTRKIKKLVLTGEETWSYYTGANARFKLNLMDEIRLPLLESIYWVCSHYEAVSNSASWVSYDSCISWSTYDGSSGLRFRDIRYSSLDDFKSYIAQQYANGTPVTVWYVLAEPETGIVNEPLMKIGNYADTIDSTQTSAQIPTSANSTTISWAGEGLAPSEVEFVYKVKG